MAQTLRLCLPVNRSSVAESGLQQGMMPDVLAIGSPSAAPCKEPFKVGRFVVVKETVQSGTSLPSLLTAGPAPHEAKQEMKEHKDSLPAIPESGLSAESPMATELPKHLLKSAPAALRVSCFNMDPMHDVPNSSMQGEGSSIFNGKAATTEKFEKPSLFSRAKSRLLDKLGVEHRRKGKLSL
eukprot:TRINITY_DN11610_c1_g1_i1.p1 TRINITY_DN11610_c1_g1~~TRINITY_DN11610_c1_g1_i1.p1  ORF type:complete len:197 (+),score=26.42 TRINITY_DN11610_c1_g1_i1:47-592(+)